MVGRSEGSPLSPLCLLPEDSLVKLQSSIRQLAVAGLEDVASHTFFQPYC